MLFVNYNNLKKYEFASSYYFENIRYILFRKDENIEGIATALESNDFINICYGFLLCPK